MNLAPQIMLVKRTRLHVAIWGLSMLALVAFCLYDWNGYQVGTYGDDGVFVVNADSLIRGVPYGMLLKPNEAEPTQFPFVFPLLLVPLRVLFPADPDATRVVPLFVTLAGMSVLFWGWREIGKGLSYRWGTALVVLSALSPLTILHARTVMSEAPFMLFCFIAIWWMEYALQKTPRAWGVVLGLTLIGVAYTRTVGWAFVPFWIAYLLWQKRRAALGQLALAALTMLGALLLVTATTSVQITDLYPQEYIQQWNRVLNIDGAPPPPTASSSAPTQPQTPSAGPTNITWVANKFRSIYSHLDFATLLPLHMEQAVTEWTNRSGIAFLRFVPGLLVVGLVVWGSIVWIRKTGISAFQLMAVPYLSVIVIWNWTPPRFFYPIQSQVFLASLLGVFALTQFIAAHAGARRTAETWAWRITVTAVVCIVAVWFWLDGRILRLTIAEGDQYARAALLNQHVPPDAIVLDVKATTDALYLERRFIAIPNRTQDTNALVQYLKRQQIEYLVIRYSMTQPSDKRPALGSTATRFANALYPLLATGLVEQRYANEQADLAIYRVRGEILESLP